MAVRYRRLNPAVNRFSIRTKGGAVCALSNIDCRDELRIDRHVRIALTTLHQSPYKQAPSGRFFHTRQFASSLTVYWRPQMPCFTVPPAPTFKPQYPPRERVLLAIGLFLSAASLITANSCPKTNNGKRTNHDEQADHNRFRHNSVNNMLHPDTPDVLASG